MRSRFLKLVILVAVFSFSWGAWWGIYHYERAHHIEHHGPEIRVLAEKNFLPPAVIKMVQNQLHVHLQITEEPTDISLVGELLSNKQKYDVVELPSFVLSSFMLNRNLSPFNTDEIPRLRNVSIDFQHLGFDPDGHYLVPISWGVSGFVFNPKQTQWSDKSLTALFGMAVKHRPPHFHSRLAKISLIDSPILFFNLLEKLKPMVKSWADTGQTAKLTKFIQQITSDVVSFTSTPESQLTSGQVQIAEMTNGEAAAFLKQHPNYRFVMPKEKGALWIRFLAISRGVKDRTLANKLIDAFLHSNINQKLIDLNHSATVLSSLNNSSLSNMQKASYIRALPLFQYQLYVDSDAIAPNWLTLYQQTVSPGPHTQP